MSRAGRRRSASPHVRRGASPSPSPGPQVVKLLGQGTYGKVYQVRFAGATAVLKHVPLHGLSPTQQREATEEASVMAHLEPHAHVIKYLDSRVSKDCLHIVMEYCSGGDLGAVIKRQRHERKLLSERLLWKYIAQLAAGLHHIHAHRILHRDMKPANVFLDEHGDVKIGDFGLGRQLAHSQDLARTTVGTPLYFSPELCDGRAYNDKSDVWSLGCLAFELAALEPPFYASNQIALAKLILEREAPFIPRTYSKELSHLVASMLHKNPNRRPSAADILRMPVVRMQLEVGHMAADARFLRRDKAALTEEVEALRRENSQHAAQLEAMKQKAADAIAAAAKVKADADAKVEEAASSAAAYGEQVKAWASTTQDSLSAAKEEVATRAVLLARRAESLFAWESALRHAQAAHDAGDDGALESALQAVEMAAKAVANTGSQRGGPPPVAVAPPPPPSKATAGGRPRGGGSPAVAPGSPSPRGAPKQRPFRRASPVPHRRASASPAPRRRNAGRLLTPPALPVVVAPTPITKHAVSSPAALSVVGRQPASGGPGASPLRRPRRVPSTPPPPRVVRSRSTPRRRPRGRAPPRKPVSEFQI